MTNKFKRLFSLLLALAMIVGMLPTMANAQENTPASNEPEEHHVFTEEDDKLLDDDVFALINDVETGAAPRAGGIGAMTEEDYIRIIPQVIEAIEASETYVPDTLKKNGCFLVWETTTGIPCCYDPRMEEKLHNTTDDPTPEEIAQAEADAKALLDDFTETRGGSPSSMKIGLIQPYWDSASNYDDSQFLSYSPSYKAMWENLYNKTGGTGMRYTMYNATIDNIAKTMEECGLVIFDSHGTTDYSNGNGDYTSRANCSYICLITNAGVTSADTTAKQGQFGTYYDVIKGSGYAYASGTAIANHMTKNAPHSLLYMGICLGMATDGMYKGLRNRGVETVWGYSQSVTFKGELTYMQSILGYVKDGDEFKDAVSKTKNATCWWDPVYSSYTESGARSARAAFPICVSSEDSYPGHGNVDAVQNVYSTWKLLGGTSIYTVTATSNNTSYGTVSVNGTIITATPKTGYYASGYTVTSGTATVTQDGNTFYVTPSTNCTVRINFAARTACTVTLKANGSTYSTLNGYVGDSFTLPTTATSVSNYKFEGWSANTISETTSKPSFYAPGASFTPSASTTLYAVYSRLESTTGGSVTSDYVCLTSAPATWDGNYIITYGNTASGMYVMKGISANETYEQNSAGVATLSSTGMSCANDTISGASDAYVFEIESSYDGKYSIKNKALGTYLARDSYDLISIGEFDSSLGLWNLGFSNGNASAQNGSGSFSYLYFSYYYSNFTLSSSSSSGIYFWKQGGNNTVTYYTTSPAGTTHTHNYGEWSSNNNGTHSRSCSCGDTQTESCTYTDVVTAPTTSSQGYTTHTCTVCGYSFRDSYTDPIAPTTYYTVKFSVPSGVSAINDQTVASGSSISLPTAGTVSGYSFAGWTTATVAETTSRPTILTGSYAPSANVTLYAVYTRTEGGSGVSGYQLLSSAPANWEGNYVITNSNTGNLFALSAVAPSYEGGMIENDDNATDIATAGMTLSDNVLTGVNDAYVFTLKSNGNGYSVQNASNNYYLGQTSSGFLGAYSSLNAELCVWMPAINADGIGRLENTAGGDYPYLGVYSSGNYFWTVREANADALLLWKQTQGGTSYYTTEPANPSVAKPVITSQPQSVSVVRGKSTTFKVVATGENLSYQWQYKKVGATAWTNWTGKTSASMTVTASGTNNGCQYRCVVSNNAGSVNSSAATLTVLSANTPVISSQPQSVSVVRGKTATFRVVATGENLSYVWQYKKVGATEWTTWSSKTSASMTVTASGTNNGCQYRCVVTSTTGTSTASVTSASATLTVLEAN